MSQHCHAHLPLCGRGWLAERGRIGGNSLFVAFIDSELGAIAILWRLVTPIVGVNNYNLECDSFWEGES